VIRMRLVGKGVSLVVTNRKVVIAAGWRGRTRWGRATVVIVLHQCRRRGRLIVTLGCRGRHHSKLIRRRHAGCCMLENTTQHVAVTAYNNSKASISTRTLELDTTTFEACRVHPNIGPNQVLGRCWSE